MIKLPMEAWRVFTPVLLVVCCTLQGYSAWTTREIYSNFKQELGHIKIEIGKGEERDEKMLAMIHDNKRDTETNRVNLSWLMKSAMASGGAYGPLPASVFKSDFRKGGD